MNKDEYLHSLRSDFSYDSPPRGGLPAKDIGGWLSFAYYIRLISTLTQASFAARRGRLDNERWAWYSHRIIEVVESVGGKVHISGLEGVSQCQGPVVYIANHMSLLEPLILPGIALAFNRVTFVIKEELRRYPVIGHIMRALKLIAVSRKNPREDLKLVLSEGHKFIANGGSIVIFPQATRSVEFDARVFNTLGVKLAKRANVPVIPVALKTDAWGIGRRLKDFGKINPRKRVHICFGEPMPVHGSGKEEHQYIIEFISEKLKTWR